MILSKKPVILILSSVFVASISGMSVFSYSPRYLLSLNVDLITIQLILSFFLLTTLVFPPIIGKISDKIQHRALLFKCGAAGVTLTFFIIIFTLNLALIVILMIIYGFFAAFVRLKFVLFAELVENDPRLIAYFAAIMALGWFLGAFLTGIFVDIFGINRFFEFLLIISLIDLVLICFIKEDREMILEHNKNQNTENLDDSILNESKEDDAISRSIYPSLFFRNFGVRPILIILAILMFYHLPNDTEIGFLLGINYLLQFFLNLIIGHFITKKNIKWIMFFGYVFSVLTIIGWILSTNFWSFLLCQIMISLSFAMFMTGTQIYVANKTTPYNKGKYDGYMFMSSQLGSFTGSLTFSLLLIMYSGDYYAAMYFMIIFPALSALIILIKFEYKLDEEKLILT